MQANDNTTKTPARRARGRAAALRSAWIAHLLCLGTLGWLRDASLSALGPFSVAGFVLFLGCEAAVALLIARARRRNAAPAGLRPSARSAGCTDGDDGGCTDSCARTCAAGGAAGA
ncbi:hypothetical protein [Streptomyces aureoversilis]|uniref:Integral membrane protein n=1 Tax=Streptomyces aureoversilis TaxID=67277 RepID=A0ABV9ZZJ2_9ACTN